jgi:hypothetical protein
MTNIHTRQHKCRCHGLKYTMLFASRNMLQVSDAHTVFSNLLVWSIQDRLCQMQSLNSFVSRPSVPFSHARMQCL